MKDESEGRAARSNKERRQLAILLFITIVLCGAFYFQWQRHLRLSDPNLPLRFEGKVAKVELRGDVDRPGVYEMHLGATVADLLNEGGGESLLDGLKTEWKQLNLVEGMMVQVWRDKEGVPQLVVNRMSGATMGVLLLKLDINDASAEDLQALPGIGEKTALAIVEYRQSHGPFATVDDLLAVRGIGPKTVEKLRYQVIAGEAAAKKNGKSASEEKAAREE